MPAANTISGSPHGQALAAVQAVEQVHRSTSDAPASASRLLILLTTEQVNRCGELFAELPKLALPVARGHHRGAKDAGGSRRARRLPGHAGGGHRRNFSLRRGSFAASNWHRAALNLRARRRINLVRTAASIRTSVPSRPSLSPPGSTVAPNQPERLAAQLERGESLALATTRNAGEAPTSRGIRRRADQELVRREQV
jgi:hypothetical protein